MTHNKYLSNFEAALRVGQPKRAELIAELKAHLLELGPDDDPDQALGRPADMATGYNRLYLGLLDRPWKVTSAAILYVVFVAVMKWWELASFRHHWPGWNLLQEDDRGFSLYLYVQLLFPLVSAALLGRIIARYHQAARLFTATWIITMIIGATFGLMNDLYTGRQDIDVPDTNSGLVFSALFIALLTTTMAAAAGFVGVFLSSWSSRHIPNPRYRQHLRFQLLLAAVFTLLLLWFSLSFVPRPFIRAIDYFLNVPLFMLIAGGGLYCWRKFRAIRALEHTSSGIN
ncbi:MAG: hypothetical protein HYY50_01150 [Candidatus Kerfeldbacteria bacterium]|nr:hypothetical protein [Candidatus Kerfeldbacteria bacterium]